MLTGLLGGTHVLPWKLRKEGIFENRERERRLAEMREAECCEFLVIRFGSSNSMGHHCTLIGLLELT